MSKQKEFECGSISTNGDGTISVEWGNKTGKWKRTPRLIPHPDFSKALDKTVKIIADYYGMGKEEHQNISFKKLMVNNYEDEKGQSVQLVAVYTHPKSMQNTPLKTAKIQVHEDAYGFETELKKLIDKLSGEANAYALEDKSSQMKMELEEAD